MLVELVTSDSNWARSITNELRHELPWRVATASDGGEALRAFVAVSPELVVVQESFAVNALSAIQICRAIRALSSSVGLVLITETDAVDKKLSAFAFGVDDCVTRTIDPRELLARMRAVVRRNSGEPPLRTERGVRPATGEHRLVHECLDVDLVTQTVKVEGMAVDLSKRQFLLLVYLIRHAGRVIREHELREHVFGYAQSINHNSTVRNHIHALRLKLGPPGQLIESVRGGGYCVRVE